jgi:hypothetical protein
MSEFKNIQLKSKKTGMVDWCTEAEYKAMVDKGVIDMSKYTVTNVKPLKSASPVEVPIQIKKGKKNEG